MSASTTSVMWRFLLSYRPIGVYSAIPHPTYVSVFHRHVCLPARHHSQLCVGLGMVSGSVSSFPIEPLLLRFLASSNVRCLYAKDDSLKHEFIGLQ
ncbi:uncharacterized protein BT62DRAFT_937523 [Guyanagaster necrorhizus]|uniref:Uncharacterized protein n=1 Tax=Guyanagaster necrorhizus TaxID=856835 RepID=A0A9P7VI23_9AGAR|nr:uncharacterized protein BT62DRAFT_937516 [Guyanagaster necrorhizus MCA 3950]XP_043034426.1 uncharacterized protein BT62DRAFT_937523 [Guyanagaster necrorhizus MCA 3950]KAG7440922.1 hypothetical protein BT62DRAFT_937516 [Guyanagaster necrorhizus MCA 3950]KAG7440926.1 hypothetical protein BT62DRAFT_937523 [Guyanagaster necrorhizus MCA 3950]